MAVVAGELAKEKLGNIFENALTKALANIEHDRLFAALIDLVEDYSTALQIPENQDNGTSLAFILGIAFGSLVGIFIIFGFASAVFSTRQQCLHGRTCWQVLCSCVQREYYVI